MTPAEEGLSDLPPRVCAECGRQVRQPDGSRSGETLCHEHEPLRLAVRANRPLYQGLLQLLSGPHRVEGGWWDRVTDDTGTTARVVVRDYWVALSEHAGVLWIFQARLAQDDTSWFLHGVFA